jgi:hypothetical protein
MRFFVLLVFSAVLVANSIIVNSPLIGMVASLGFLSLISVVIGEVLYSSENLFFKCLFGLATFLLLLAISGFGLMFIGMFTEFLSLVVLVVIGVLFGAIALRRKRSQFQGIRESSSLGKRGKKSKNLNSYLLILTFLFYVVVAFRFLLLARTSEGGASVWLEISPLFVPTFAVMSLILALILFFTPVNDSLKLVLLLVYAFLVHSLFLIVWYPSRYGDPLQHLGEARYTARTGTIYAYGWLTSNFLIVPLVMGRAQYSLVIFFERMFSIDIYWTHAFIVPLLWSIFVPSLAYKIAELLTTKRTRVFPLLTALTTGLFSSLILWGTISVPNSLGFIFFFLSAVLLLRWMKSGGRWNWFMSLLAVSVTLLTHLQPGLFALILFFWGNIVQRSSRIVLRIASLFLISILYPAALYISGASFATPGLFILENFLSFQSEITTILLAFGLVGLMLKVRGKYVNLKIALTVFAFYVTILFEYYLTNFGMTNLPYGPQRILVMGDFFLVPFVGLGLLAITDMLRKGVEKGGKKFSIDFSSKRIRLNLNSRLIALALISLFVSAQATSILYQAYPRKEAVYYQPSAYMIEAVRYIDADAPSRYVVLCDFTFARVAIGFLGIDYGWAGGVRGVFGMPEWTYPTMAMYADMIKKPSVEIMQAAMSLFNASVSYFVVWVGQFGFDEIVQMASEILPVNLVFGDGNLYIFRYPLPVIKESGPPVKVIFDDGVLTRTVETTLTYMFETEINSTLTLSGYTSYNITEYPIHWTFSDLRVNNFSKPFDEVSDINTFIYVTGLEPNDILTVKWRWNRKYSSAVWKDDSFRSGWRTHDLYKGTIVPTIVNDGNILHVSHSFTSGPYLYYYYVKPVDILTTENQYIMVRWKSNGTVAVVAYYSELGLGSGFEVVRVGGESTDWTLTTVELPSNATVTYVMVGISNIRTRSISGMITLSVDYILISTST